MSVLCKFAVDTLTDQVIVRSDLPIAVSKAADGQHSCGKKTSVWELKLIILQ